MFVVESRVSAVFNNILGDTGQESEFQNHIQKTSEQDSTNIMFFTRLLTMSRIWVTNISTKYLIVRFGPLSRGFFPYVSNDKQFSDRIASRCRFVHLHPH